MADRRLAHHSPFPARLLELSTCINKERLDIKGNPPLTPYTVINCNRCHNNLASSPSSLNIWIESHSLRILSIASPAPSMWNTSPSAAWMLRSLREIFGYSGIRWGNSRSDAEGTAPGNGNPIYIPSVRCPSSTKFNRYRVELFSIIVSHM